MDSLLAPFFSVEFGYAVIRMLTPLLPAALGVALSQLAGVVNIAMEGIMLTAALVGVLTSAWTGSLVLALLAGVAAGAGMGALLGTVHLKLKADIVLSGIALNMFASGGTVFLLSLVTGDKGSSSSLKSLVFPRIEIPLLSEVPLAGPLLSGHNVLTYLTLLLPPVLFLFLFRTPFGLRLRATGQNHRAAESVGIGVNRIKMTALVLSGALGALGGLYLSMGYVSWFGRDMTAGRGFIAIAAAALGRYLPLGVLGASLLFALAGAVAIYLASLEVPPELIQMLPYLVTVVALTLVSRPEKAGERGLLRKIRFRRKR